jgi:chromosome segregation ATPase
VIDVYRFAEASPKGWSIGAPATAPQAAKSTEPDLLPGTVSRLNAFVPDKMAQIEDLYRELLAQAEARHKAQVEELATHLSQTEEHHKAQVEELEAHHKAQAEELSARIKHINQHLREKNVNITESEARGDELKANLRQRWKVPRSSPGFGRG